MGVKKVNEGKICSRAEEKVYKKDFEGSFKKDFNKL